MSLTDDDKKWISEMVSEQIHDAETRLLTAFHKSASPTQARQRAHTLFLHTIDLEAEALTDRVAKLEKRSDPDARPAAG